MEKLKRKKLSEERINDIQERFYVTNRYLLIVLVGATWKAYSSSAYVISDLMGYQLKRKIKKNSYVDFVAFPKSASKKVFSNIVKASGLIVKRIGRVVVYSWNAPIIISHNISLVQRKYLQFNLKLDTETYTQLNRITKNGGFGGKDKATKSEVIRYAIKHFYDNKPVNLKEVESLIKAISENRDKLSSGLETLSRLIRELNAIGVNLNQITHRLNATMNKAIEEGVNIEKQIDIINDFWNGVVDMLEKLDHILPEIRPAIEPVQNATLEAMNGENEIIRRLLI